MKTILRLGEGLQLLTLLKPEWAKLYVPNGTSCIKPRTHLSVMTGFVLQTATLTSRSKWKRNVERRRYNRKRRDAFYSKHKKELDSYIKSHEYLTKVLNGKKVIPAKAWKAEYSKLTAKRYSCSEKYYNLSTEIKSVEQIQRSAMELIQGIQMERKPQRTINLER